MREHGPFLFWENQNMDGLLFALVFGTCIILYFLPYIIAENRHHRNLKSIAVVNICLGWTFLGWVVALAWAFSNDTGGTHEG
jgi:threonine/homoserine/homoserine lactone efflux protein